MVKKNKFKHLLIIRLSAMGDVAMVPHAIRALRENYPNLRISILTRKAFQPMFDGLDVEFVKLDLLESHTGLVGIRRLAREISNLSVDCVADLHNVLRTKLLRTFLKIEGIDSKSLDKGRMHKWMRLDGGCGGETISLPHMVTRYCNVLRELGFDVEDPGPAPKMPRKNPMPFEKGDEKWVGVAPFSAHRGKIYPIDLMRDVIAQLSARYNRVFVHTGGGAELEFAEEMQSKHPNVHAIFSKVTLGQEIDLISNLDCMVSMDSFAMHVASLVATPVVSVWGATHPMLGFAGYMTPKESFVQAEWMTCRPCSVYGSKPCKFHDYRCMRAIEPIEITERVEYFTK
ncbi:MAG: glycosyltransferase family 9 protein [Rikenellaceae bacterium]